MGAKIIDYKSLIENLKTTAAQAGDSYLECSAKELMGKLNEGNATLITCCSAMRQCMLSGDEMIVAPTGKKNVSTKMKVRYYLNDLGSRESAYIPKKRGRKAGSTLKKNPGFKRNPKTGKLEAKFNKAYMTQSLQTWLDKKKLAYEEQEDAYLVQTPEGKWLIEVDYEKRGKKQTFNSKMYSLIKRMNPDIVKYSIMMESKISSKQEWKQLSDYMKSRLGISLIFVNHQGKVKEYR